MLYYAQLIDTSDMSYVEISRLASTLERLINDMSTVVKCYNRHGYNISKVKVFNGNKKLLTIINYR